MEEFLTVRIARKVLEAPDVFSFELQSLGSAPLPAFTAGSHLDVRVTESLTRQYSICNDPSDTNRYEIAVARARDSRGGSSALIDNYGPGDLLHVSRPKNHFSLEESAPFSLLIAGGIGVTPLLGMAHRLMHLRSHFEFHYFTRSRAETPFDARIRASKFAANTQFQYDLEPVQAKSRLDMLISSARTDSHLYVCGPTQFMEHALSCARLGGWPEERLHSEHFSNELLAENDAAPPFELRLARRGCSITVAPDETAVHALRRAGIEVETSCEEGVCGTCLVTVLDGVPDHRDAYLTSAERSANNQFLPCCSRSRSSYLVVDL